MHPVVARARTDLALRRHFAAFRLCVAVFGDHRLFGPPARHRSGPPLPPVAEKIALMGILGGLVGWLLEHDRRHPENEGARRPG